MSQYTRSISFELLLAIALVAGSLALLPAIIVFMGGHLFGAYQGGLKQFYLHLFGDLASFTWSAWVLALVPAVCVLALRRLLRRPHSAQ